MDGYIYSFNGRSYRDVESLWAERIEKLTQNVSIGVDKFGEIFSHFSSLNVWLLIGEGSTDPLQHPHLRFL